MDQTVKLPAHVDAAFARIDAAVPAELVATMRRVHARFDAEPQSFTLAGPQGNLTFRADSFPLRMMAGIVRQESRRHPAARRRLCRARRRRRRSRSRRSIYGFFYKDPLTMTGMPELMDVASGISARAARSGPAAGARLAHRHGGQFPDAAAARRRAGARPRRPLPPRDPLEPSRCCCSAAISTSAPRSRSRRRRRRACRSLHRILVRNGGHDLFEAHPDVPGAADRLLLRPAGDGARAGAAAARHGPLTRTSRIRDGFAKINR